MATLAPAYAPRRPTEAVLYSLVRQHIESFLAYAREHYDRGFHRYVEQELRAFLKCGVFSNGFSQAQCDRVWTRATHHLLLPRSQHLPELLRTAHGQRGRSPGRPGLARRTRRQYVLSLPYDLRRLAAFKAEVLTALARTFVEAVFASYRARAKRDGIDGAECGSVLCVQRFGSLNLNVHFHVLVLDGVFARDPLERVVFHPAPPTTIADLNGIVERTRRRAGVRLRRHGFLDERALDERSQEPEAQIALDACAAVAIRRGQVATRARPGAADAADEDHEQAPYKAAVAVESEGFNLHAGVCVEARGPTATLAPSPRPQERPPGEGRYSRNNGRLSTTRSPASPRLRLWRRCVPDRLRGPATSSCSHRMQRGLHIASAGREPANPEFLQ